MKRKLITTGLLAGAILSHSSSIYAETQKFPDVPKWAEQSVNYLVDKQVLRGYPDGIFGSNDSLDRASAATIMTKILGIQIDFDAKPSFTDSQNHWATPYIAAAEKAGIIKGEGNGIFNPTGKVTRAAMATMLVNAYKLQSTANDNGQSKFEDLKGHWGEKYANILIDLKISSGTDNGWQPNRFITRAEAAQLTAKTDMLSREMNSELKEKDYTSTNTLLNQHQKLSGKVIEKTEDGLVVSGENSSVYAIVSSPEVLKDIKIGDTVTIYGASFMSNMATGELSAKAPIIEKLASKTVTLNTSVDNTTSVESKSPNTNTALSVHHEKEQALLNQHKKLSGKVTTKTENSLIISNGNSILDAMVASPEILKDIQIGDTVTIYAPIFIDGLVFGEPDTAKYAIAQKENEENVLKKQYKMHTGNVINKSKDTIEISSEGSTVSAIVSSEVLQDIKIGDTVTIYGASFMSNMATGELSAKAPIIEKLAR